MYWQRTIFAGMNVGFLIQEKKVPVTVSSQSIFLITNHTFIVADLFKTITFLLFACITFCDMLEIWLSAVHEQSCFNSHTTMTWGFFRPSSKSGVLTMLLWAKQNLFALILNEFGLEMPLSYLICWGSICCCSNNSNSKTIYSLSHFETTSVNQ